jgi:hypothetical protein
MTDVVDTPTPEYDPPTPDEDFAPPSAEQIDDWFGIASHSVMAINGIIDGSRALEYTQDEKNDAVDRNVKHLQIQETQQWYTDDSESRTAPADKASISAAITAGKTYMADNGYTYEDYGS